jgi:hypothetical protein
MLHIAPSALGRGTVRTMCFPVVVCVAILAENREAANYNVRNTKTKMENTQER